MKELTTIAELRAFCSAAPRPLGLVPTMGALHDGHLALVRCAREACRTVVTTIFVNPTQFGPSEDLSRYPRTLDRDLGMLTRAGVDGVFVPSAEEMYPAGFATTVHVEGPALPLEGHFRPSHFDGVATIVAKLLLVSLPDCAYFGQKDAQQVAIVRRVITDLHVPVAVEIVPTVREPDGLAMSSRNAYLTAEQREAATAIFRALRAAQQQFDAGERDPHALEAHARSVLLQEPLVDTIDYVAVVERDTMTPWRGVGQPLLAIAARIGATRLIDNVLLGDA